MLPLAHHFNKQNTTCLIGRHHEQAAFKQAIANALESKQAPWKILNLYGPGGVGKSTLLDTYRHIAETCGVQYHYLDAYDFTDKSDTFIKCLADSLGIPPNVSLNELISALKQQTAQHPIVVAIDTFEDTGKLNRWLREQFLPQLPCSCIVVIAGRFPLIELWASHPIWQQLILALPLDNFDKTQTKEFLLRNGIHSPSITEQIWTYTRGYPLALSLSLMLPDKTQNSAPLLTNTGIVTELTQHWLNNISTPSLKILLEAATAVRHFNQDMLTQISGDNVSNKLFQQLVNHTFIRHSLKGWHIHPMVRNALDRTLYQQDPERYTQPLLRALNTVSNMAAHSNHSREEALQEFFYLLGNGLLRALFHNEETNEYSDLFMEYAEYSDKEALNAYMNEWRNRRGEVTPEVYEPEFIPIEEWLTQIPHSIRLLKDQSNTMQGINIVLPINNKTFDYLTKQPVIRHYFASLSKEALSAFRTPATQTHCWFIRLMDTCQPSGHCARARLLKDLGELFIQPARFITSTPLTLCQQLLEQFGFEKTLHPEHDDFGKDCPAPFFELDLRGERLQQCLEKIFKKHTNARTDISFKSLLTSALAKAQQENNIGNTQNQSMHMSLDKLTAREKEVALAATEGIPNCAIATRLNISEITVKKHMSNVYAKLGVRNRAELIKDFWSR